MADRKTLQDGLKELEKGGQFEFVRNGQDWKLLVNGTEVAVLTEVQKNYVSRDVQGYESANEAQKADMDRKLTEEVKLALRNLIITPSIANNLDAVAAEIIMGWTRQGDQSECGCLSYRTGNGTVHHVAKNNDAGCKSHQVWSPSTNLTATRDLLEKPFPCSDGRHLAITNIKSEGKAMAPAPGQPLAITTKNVVSGRTVITFRNAGRTESFDVVDEKCHPPAAVCIAALRLIGINVQHS